MALVYCYLATPDCVHMCPLMNEITFGGEHINTDPSPRDPHKVPQFHPRALPKNTRNFVVQTILLYTPLILNKPIDFVPTPAKMQQTYNNNQKLFRTNNIMGCSALVVLFLCLTTTANGFIDEIENDRNFFGDTWRIKSDREPSVGDGDYIKASRIETAIRSLPDEDRRIRLLKENLLGNRRVLTSNRCLDRDFGSWREQDNRRSLANSRRDNFEREDRSRDSRNSPSRRLSTEDRVRAVRSFILMERSRENQARQNFENGRESYEREDRTRNIVKREDRRLSDDRSRLSDRLSRTEQQVLSIRSTGSRKNQIDRQEFNDRRVLANSRQGDQRSSDNSLRQSVDSQRATNDRVRDVRSSSMDRSRENQVDRREIDDRRVLANSRRENLVREDRIRDSRDRDNSLRRSVESGRVTEPPTEDSRTVRLSRSLDRSRQHQIDRRDFDNRRVLANFRRENSVREDRSHNSRDRETSDNSLRQSVENRRVTEPLTEDRARNLQFSRSLDRSRKNQVDKRDSDNRRVLANSRRENLVREDRIRDSRDRDNSLRRSVESRRVTEPPTEDSRTVRLSRSLDRSLDRSRVLADFRLENSVREDRTRDSRDRDNSLRRSVESRRATNHRVRDVRFSSMGRSRENQVVRRDFNDRRVLANSRRENSVREDRSREPKDRSTFDDSLRQTTDRVRDARSSSMDRSRENQVDRRDFNDRRVLANSRRENSVREDRTREPKDRRTFDDSLSQTTDRVRDARSSSMDRSRENQVGRGDFNDRRVLANSRHENSLREDRTREPKDQRTFDDSLRQTTDRVRNVRSSPMDRSRENQVDRREFNDRRVLANSRRENLVRDDRTRYSRDRDNSPRQSVESQRVLGTEPLTEDHARAVRFARSLDRSRENQIDRRDFDNRRVLASLSRKNIEREDRTRQSVFSATNPTEDRDRTLSSSRSIDRSRQNQNTRRELDNRRVLIDSRRGSFEREDRSRNSRRGKISEDSSRRSVEDLRDSVTRSPREDRVLAVRSSSVDRLLLSRENLESRRVATENQTTRREIDTRRVPESRDRGVRDHFERRETDSTRNIVAQSREFKSIDDFVNVNYIPAEKSTMLLNAAKILLISFLLAQVLSNANNSKKGNWFNQKLNFVGVTKEKVL